MSSSLRFPTIATELSWRYITSFSDSCKRTIYVSPIYSVIKL
ncbi:hypothetical protein Hanom_Chr04g00342661 [Helianthus anomalus]